MLLTGIFCEDDVWFGYKDAWCTFVFYSVCSLSRQQQKQHDNSSWIFNLELTTWNSLGMCTHWMSAFIADSESVWPQIAQILLEATTSKQFIQLTDCTNRLHVC